MKYNITKEEVLGLLDDFNKYTETAEQHEFPLLAIIKVKLEQSIEEFPYINIAELNCMFRVVYKAIGKDFSEYE